MTVKINNVVIPQPTLLKEELVQIQTDTFSISGKMQRNRIGQKKQSTLEWAELSPSQYQTLIGYMTTGSGFYYSNDASNYTGGLFVYSGMPSFSEDSYVPGASLYRNFRAVIREL